MARLVEAMSESNTPTAPEIRIAFRFERRVTLQPLWYDERWHQEMLEEGWTDEGALREMLRAGFNEDWTSMIQEMIESGQSYADEFVDSITWVALVDEEGQPLTEIGE